MALKSLIKTPEGGVSVGLAEAAAVYVIYQSALPSHAEIRISDTQNTDIEAARKRAAWKSAAILAVVFLITQDLNAFLIGGAALGGIDLMVKHANAVNPSTGKMAGTGNEGNVNPFPLANYSDQAS